MDREKVTVERWVSVERCCPVPHVNIFTIALHLILIHVSELSFAVLAVEGNVVPRCVLG